MVSMAGFSSSLFQREDNPVPEDTPEKIVNPLGFLLIVTLFWTIILSLPLTYVEYILRKKILNQKEIGEPLIIKLVEHIGSWAESIEEVFILEDVSICYEHEYSYYRCMLAGVRFSHMEDDTKEEYRDTVTEKMLDAKEKFLILRLSGVE